MTDLSADIVFLYVTAPSNDVARQIGRLLIDKKLAACVNIHAPMQSVYEWEGNIENETEVPLIVKTTAAQSNAARDAIITSHPYDEPCVAAFPILESGSSAGFLKWISATVRT